MVFPGTGRLRFGCNLRGLENGLATQYGKQRVGVLRRGILLGLLVAGILWVWALRGLFFPFFLGALLAYLLAPWMNRLEKRGVARSRAILILYLLIGGGLSLLLTALLPLFFMEGSRLLADLPRLSHRIEGWIRHAHGFYRHALLPGPLRQALDSAVVSAQHRLERFLRQVLGSLFGLLPALLNLILAPILAYYLLLEAPKLRQLLFSWIPPEEEEPFARMLWEMDRIVGGFIRGQMLVALFVGGFTALEFWILGIPYSLLLGVFVALLDVVPYLGAFLGAFPAVVVTLLMAPGKLLWVVLALFLAHQLEGGILSPRLLGAQMGLSPFWVMIALLAGGEWGGVVGMLLGVPLFAAALVLARYLLRFAVAPPKWR